MIFPTEFTEMHALISNIQKYSIHDGPGIRTTVFFTGCTLRCLWCSNPETIKMHPQLGIYPGKCIGVDKCGHCQRICPENSPERLIFDENGILKSLEMSDVCQNCLACADICPPRAIKQWGKIITLPALVNIIAGDKTFYDRSGGGVTLSGGEVMLQWEFASALLDACKKLSINTCVETALNCPTEHMEAVYKYTDLVIADIKHMDDAAHKRFTGVGNALILSNIKKTVELGKKLVIRTPVVPGYNGGDENIRKTAEFIKNELDGNIVGYQLLPFRKLGTEKYASLMLPYPMESYHAPARSDWEKNLLRLTDILVNEYGLPAFAGSGRKLE